MYLSKLKIWNFRKYGEKENQQPGLELEFNEGLNLLVGENNSGKTSIVDAIKHVIHTQSYDYVRFESEDFHLPNGASEETRANELKIECIFTDFNEEEAKNFIEWASIYREDSVRYFLKVILTAKRTDNGIFSDIRAGSDEEGKQLNGEARNFLRATYLKPLRDAEKEMSPGRNSRLAQILQNHDAFKGKEEDHYIFNIIKEANDQITKYFEGESVAGEPLDDLEGQKLLEQVNTYLGAFSGNKSSQTSDFSISELRLKNILERLNLNLTETKTGLGSQNLLFIAAELLLLKRDSFSGIRLALIEEIEAHLHVQAQIRLIEYLQEEVEDSKVQLLVTTHSTDLASKVKLENLIICKDELALPMGPDFTQLNKGDYLFLERFLDATKANLFFAQGVILVEGDSENLLIPVLAKIIGKPLHLYGVTVVNVGNTAFLRYSRIFKRSKEGSSHLKVPVAAITDNDIKPDIYGEVENVPTKNKLNEIQPIAERREERKEKIDGQFVKLFISPEWTLEFDMALGALNKELLTAILRAERIRNSDKIGLTEEKIDEVDSEVNKLFEKWLDEDWPAEQIAFEIYYNIMLKKRISKAITAQCLAGILEKEFQTNKEEIKERINSDEQLSYLIEAITYATEGR